MPRAPRAAAADAAVFGDRWNGESARLGERVHFRLRIRGRWGFAGASIDVPPTAPLAGVRLGHTTMSLLFGPMQAHMGLAFRAVGHVGRRSRPSLAPVRCRIIDDTTKLDSQSDRMVNWSR